MFPIVQSPPSCNLPHRAPRPLAGVVPCLPHPARMCRHTTPPPLPPPFAAAGPHDEPFLLHFLLNFPHTSPTHVPFHTRAPPCLLFQVQHRMTDVLSSPFPLQAPPHIPFHTSVPPLLQVQYRMKDEYGVDTTLEPVPFSIARWVLGGWDAVAAAGRMFNTITVKDMYGRPVLLFKNEFALNTVG
eukprot:365354-Chlamydomonas_euryale.AAC.1